LALSKVCAKEINQKKLKQSNEQSLSHGFRPLLLTSGGTQKRPSEMKMTAWRDGSPLCTTQQTSTTGMDASTSTSAPTLPFPEKQKERRDD